MCLQMQSHVICAINSNMLKRILLYLSIIPLLMLLASCSSQPELPRLPPDAMILAFGDSLTYGSGAKRDESYPAVLSRLTGLDVINAGVPGEVTSEGLARLPDVLDEFQPQLMIICHGGNDMLRQQGMQRAEKNLRSMIQLAQQQGVSVVLMAVPKPGVLLSSVDFYEAIAEEMQIPFEGDVVADVLSKRSLKSDLIHPNAKGYDIIAEAIFQLMKEAKLIE